MTNQEISKNIAITEDEITAKCSPAEAVRGLLNRFSAKIPMQNSEEIFAPDVDSPSDKVVVPLVVYVDGERHVVGEAKVDILGEHFLVEGQISNPSYEALIMPRLRSLSDFSIDTPSQEELIASSDPIEALGKFLED